MEGLDICLNLALRPWWEVGCFRYPKYPCNSENIRPYPRDRAGDVGRGGFPPPSRSHFLEWLKYFFFCSSYPDLSLTTQTRFSNLTILNTHKQRTDKLCLVAVANEFVALNDNRKGNFGTFRESDLKMSGWHPTVACAGFSFKVYSLKFWSNVGARL